MATEAVDGSNQIAGVLDVYGERGLEYPERKRGDKNEVCSCVVVYMHLRTCMKFRVRRLPLSNAKQNITLIQRGGSVHLLGLSISSSLSA